MAEGIPSGNSTGNIFEVWLCHLKEDAFQRGINNMVVDKALEGVIPSEEILKKDQNQPELKLSADTYLKRMVDEIRIFKGITALRENHILLQEISTKYGVPAPVLVAIWGIESSYGTFTGNWDVIQSLVTLAYGCEKPNRANYFREELIHALMIIEGGHGPLEGKRLKGSWAGAMGQCQFMPSSFLSYAVDQDGDGHADIWESLTDILASMANYLKKHGWKEGHPFALKVSVPGTLDTSMLGLAVRKMVTEWKSHFEVQLMEQEKEPLDNEIASLVAPDGLQGATYLVFDNFRTIMRYNTSVLYSLSVFELSQEIAIRARQD